MSWDSYDALLAEIEGRDPSTGRDKPFQPNIAAKLGMRKLYAERMAKGLNAHGKPLVAPEKRNHRYGFKKPWKLGTHLTGMPNRKKPHGKRKYMARYQQWRRSPLFVPALDERFAANFEQFKRLKHYQDSVSDTFRLDSARKEANRLYHKRYAQERRDLFVSMGYTSTGKERKRRISHPRAFNALLGDT